MTPLVEEADNLRLWVAEAKKAFEALLARSRRDNEEATKVGKEQFELLQKDAEAHQKILDLLVEVEKERELKLGVEEKLMALEKRVSLDAEVVARLCKERDEFFQTAERLYSEHGTAHEERD